MDNKIATQQGNINKFMSYCDSVLKEPVANVTKGFLDAKNKVISEIWRKIDCANDEIVEVADADDLKSNYFTRDEFNAAFEMYDKVNIKIQTSLEKFNKPVVPNVPPIQLPANLTLNATGDKSKLKLKPVDIPVFSGDYKKWLSFRSLFDSMVHNNDKVEELEKMHYLKSCLSGDAEGLISQFDVTAQEYQEAYQVITDRFHNEVILVDAHIMDLLSQPNLTSESGEAIKKLMDVTSSNLRALKTLKIDTSTWDPILLLLLVQKLDRCTKRLWEQTLKPKVRPTMKEFLEFLGTRFHSLGCQQNFNFSIEAKTESSQSRYRKFKRNFGKDDSFDHSHSFPPRVHQTFHNTSHNNQRKCSFGCGENHAATDCESFRKAKLEVRTEFVNGNKLCKNCLRGHAGKCNSRPNCQKCGKYHHTLLHPEQSDPRGNNRSAPAINRIAEPQQSNQTRSSELSLKNHHAHIQQTEKRTQVNNDTEVSECIAWDEPVLLATAIVLIRSCRDNIFYPFRALLDQASEASYITENVLQFLGLKKQAVVASSSGLGGVKTGNIKYVADFEIGSKRNPSFSMKAQAPVAQKISHPFPSTSLQETDWHHIKDLQLADPDFRIPGNIDL